MLTGVGIGVSCNSGPKVFIIDPATTPIVAGLVGVFEGDVYLSYDDGNGNYFWYKIGDPLPTILVDLNGVSLSDIDGNLLIL